jgi:hypothetical protein
MSFITLIKRNTHLITNLLGCEQACWFDNGTFAADSIGVNRGEPEAPQWHVNIAGYMLPSAPARPAGCLPNSTSALHSSPAGRHCPTPPARRALLETPICDNTSPKNRRWRYSPDALQQSAVGLTPLSHHAAPDHWRFSPWNRGLGYDHLSDQADRMFLSGIAPWLSDMAPPAFISEAQVRVKLCRFDQAAIQLFCARFPALLLATFLCSKWQPRSLGKNIPKHTEVLLMVLSVTLRSVQPFCKLTLPSRSNVHRLFNLPNAWGLRRGKAQRFFAQSVVQTKCAIWCPGEPCLSAAKPSALKTCRGSRNAGSLHKACWTFWNARSSLARACSVWQRHD